tara:strand:- start:22000 stop:22659 length:660 start_codon:yes stop_codon:yes gene_type:complete
MSKLQKYNLLKKTAIELTATNPNLSVKDIAKELGISDRTLIKWRSDPNFLEAVEKRYMVVLGSKIPAITEAMVREAQTGNVQAARLVYEFAGKLIKKQEINILSPYEIHFGNINNMNVDDAEDAEVMEAIEEIEIPNIETLPDRDIEPPVKRQIREKKQIDDAIKKEKYSQKRKEWYQWQKRAKAAGVEPLSARRPTKGQRKAWEDEIIKKEKDAEANN